MEDLALKYYSSYISVKGEKSKKAEEAI